MKTSFVCLLSLLALGSCSKDPFVEADFSTAGTLQNFTPIQFNNLSTGAQQYHWDFGDSTSSTDANPAHTFRRPGQYSVVLDATATGITSRKLQVLTIVQADTLSIITNSVAGRYRCTKVQFFCYGGGCPTPVPAVQSCDTILTIRSAANGILVNNITRIIPLTNTFSGYNFFVLNGGSSAANHYSAFFKAQTDSLAFGDSSGGSGGGYRHVYYGRKVQ